MRHVRSLQTYNHVWATVVLGHRYSEVYIADTGTAVALAMCFDSKYQICIDAKSRLFEVRPMGSLWLKGNAKCFFKLKLSTMDTRVKSQMVS